MRTPETPEDQAKRRKIFLGLGAGAVLIAAGIKVFRDVTCEKTTSVLDAAQKPESPPAPPHTGIPNIEIPEDRSIAIPEFEFSDTPVAFKPPRGLSMPKEEFGPFTAAIGEEILKMLHRNAIPELRSLRNQAEQEQFYINLTGQMASLIQHMDPRAAQEMIDFEKNWNHQGETLVAHLNEYLNPANYYLFLQQDEQARMELSFFPLQKTSTITGSDPKGTVAIPVFHIGDDLLPKPAEGRGGFVMAGTDHFSTHVFFREKNKKRGMNAISAQGYRYPRFQKPENQASFERHFFEDMARRAATDVFLTKRFPNIAPVRATVQYFQLSFNIPLGDGVLEFSDRYAPAMMIAAAGAGMQLAKTQEDTLSLHGVLFDLDAPSEFLLRQLLPLATLESSPPSQLKQDLISILQRTNELPAEKLLELIGTPPFSVEHTRRTGEILYRFAYKLLEQAERGGLELRELPTTE